MTEGSPHVNDIVAKALGLTDAQERQAYLNQACGSDAELRARVDALLSHTLLPDKSAPSPDDEPEVTFAIRRDSPQREVQFMPEAPGNRIGPYKLLQELGEGGMGTVYMAEQEEPIRRLVALKLIKPGMDSREVLARFEVERQALALMDHPNIAKVHHADITAAGRPYFVMELVKGIPITQFCDENRLTATERLELFVPVCQAVQHAHQKGIIHRDLKPSNILVAMYDDKPVPKVIDFGVAKATSQKLTERTLFTGFGAVVGTLEYMSPEQAKMNALDIDTRSDVYSLGVILYELLTGETPLQRNRANQHALDELLRVIREEEPPKPSTKLSTSDSLPSISKQRRVDPNELMSLLRGELDWIVMKALEKDRSRRYDSANGLARDIMRFLADETVEACPPSLPYRMQKFTRKHRKAMVLSGAFLALLIVGTIAATWQAIRAGFAEAEALVLRDAAVTNEKKAKESEKRAEESARTAKVNEEKARDNEKAAHKERDIARAAKEELRQNLYLSQLNLVQNAWEANKVERALELLRPPPLQDGETDLRSFEWHYWKRRCSAEIATIKLPERASAFAFNHDSTRVAGLHDGEVKLWDAATAKQVFGSLGKSFALSLDGKRVGIASLQEKPGQPRECVVEVHEPAAKMVVFQTRLPGFKGAELLDSVPALAFDAPAGRLAVAGRIDKTAELKVWDLAGNKEVFARAAAGGVYRQAVFSSDGRLLAAALDLLKSNTRRVQVWDVIQKKELYTFELTKLIRPIGAGLTRHFSPDRCLAFSPDGTRLATLEWGAEENVKVWDAQTGQFLYGFAESSGKPSALTFSPDSKCLAALGQGLVTFWEAPVSLPNIARHPTHFVKWPVQDREAANLCFSADGQRLYSAELNGAIRTWEVTPPPCFPSKGLVAKKGKLPNRLLGPQGSLLATAFGTGGAIGELKVYDIKGTLVGQAPFSVPSSSDGFFGLAALHPKAGYVATVTPGNAPSSHTLNVWEIATGKLKVAIPAVADRKYASTAFTGDGKRLAALVVDPPQVRFWDADTGKDLLVLGVGANSQKLTLSPDGRRACLIETVGDDNKLDYELKLWEAPSTAKPRTLVTSPLRIEETAFSPDGKHIAAAIGTITTLGPLGPRTQSEVKVWDAETAALRFTLKTPSGQQFKALAFSPDSRRLATAENDLNGIAHVVKLWDVETGREVLTLKAGEQITRLAFSADGYRLFGQLLNPSPRGDLVQLWEATPNP